MTLPRAITARDSWQCCREVTETSPKNVRGLHRRRHAEEVAEAKESHTGRFLKRVLKRHSLIAGR